MFTALPRRPQCLIFVERWVAIEAPTLGHRTAGTSLPRAMEIQGREARTATQHPQPMRSGGQLRAPGVQLNPLAAASALWADGESSERPREFSRPQARLAGGRVTKHRPIPGHLAAFQGCPGCSPRRQRQPLAFPRLAEPARAQGRAHRPLTHASTAPHIPSTAPHIPKQSGPARHVEAVLHIHPVPSS